MGTRSVKPMYVNGRETRVGYLNNLRVEEGFRRTLHLARGYRMLKELHEDGKARIYLSTVLSNNAAALRLAGKRGGLPAYNDIGQITTMAVPLSQRSPSPQKGMFDIRGATHDDVPLLTD